jgi:hypothetical protein
MIKHLIPKYSEHSPVPSLSLKKHSPVASAETSSSSSASIYFVRSSRISVPVPAPPARSRWRSGPCWTLDFRVSFLFYSLLLHFLGVLCIVCKVKRCWAASTAAHVPWRRRQLVIFSASGGLGWNKFISPVWLCGLIYGAISFIRSQAKCSNHCYQIKVSFLFLLKSPYLVGILVYQISSSCVLSITLFKSPFPLTPCKK